MKPLDVWIHLATTDQAGALTYYEDAPPGVREQIDRYCRQLTLELGRIAGDLTLVWERMREYVYPAHAWPESDEG